MKNTLPQLLSVRSRRSLALFAAMAALSVSYAAPFEKPDSSFTGTVRATTTLIEPGTEVEIAGQAFNVGGGPTRTLSLLELVGIIEDRIGGRIPLRYADWRPGDQTVYVSDVSKARDVLGWAPEVGVKAGVGKLIDWVDANRALF